jgi:hypothetical protein
MVRKNNLAPLREEIDSNEAYFRSCAEYPHTLFLNTKGIPVLQIGR